MLADAGASVPNPPLKILLALADGPLVASPTYTDITADGAKVVSIEITRGRGSPEDGFSAGTCSVSLDNQDGRWQTGGASWKYPTLDTDHKIQIVETYEGTDYPQFTGYTEDVEEDFPSPVEHMALIPCADAFGFLSEARIDEHTFDTEETSGNRIKAILDHPDVAFPGAGTLVTANHRNLAAGVQSVPEQALKDHSALEAIQHVEQSEGGRFYVASSGALTFLDRDAFDLGSTPSTAYNTGQGIIGDSGSELPYQNFKLGRPRHRIRNRITCSRQDGAMQMAKDAASIAAHGTKSEPVEELLLLTDNEALDRAYYELIRRKLSVVTVEPITVNPDSKPEWWPVVVRDILNHRYTVRKHTPAGNLREFLVTVEGLSHQINYAPGEGEPWRLVTYRLSIADPNSYWIYEDATYGVLGSTTRLGY